MLLLTVLATVFFYRHPIAIKSIQYFTKAYDVNITCLDFSLDWRLNLNVEQACIASPMGNVQVSKAIWQPWPNVLDIEQIKIAHFEQNAADNQVDTALSDKPKEQNTSFPDSLPTLSILSLEIDSYLLLQPLRLSVNPISSNELSITGDVNATVKTNQNTLVGDILVADIEWRLSGLTKWIPQVQNLLQSNAELLKDVALDESKIKTSLTFDGKILSADSSFNTVSRIYISQCPIDAVIKGDVLVDMEVSSLNIGLDLSQLSNDISVQDCPLLLDYFAEDDLPQLSLIFEQKLAIDKTQINLPTLQIVDKQNPNRSIVLNDLNFKTTGEFAVNYNISLKQPIKTKQITAGMLDFQSNGLFSANISKDTKNTSTLNTSNTQQPFSWKVTDDNNQLVITDLAMDTLLIGKLTTEFSFHYSGLNPLELKGTLNSSDIQMGVVKLAKTNSVFSLLVTNFDDFQLSIDSQFAQLGLPDLGIQNISNHIDMNIKEFETLSFSGNSSITKLSAQNINFLPIDITHTGQVGLSNMSISSQHDIHLEHGFLVAIEQQRTQATVQINQQDIISLQSIISQLEDALVIKQGNLSASIELTLPLEGESFIAQGNADFQGVSLKYQDYQLNYMTYQTPLIFDSAGLQLVESTLHIDSIDAGVAIEQLKANVIAQNSVLRLTQIEGEIFNGKFSLADLWLDGREQEFNINIQSIDLAEIVALQQQPGIQITGNIDGDMPFIMGKQGIRVEDGWVSSLTGGKLTIVDNPSFDSIKGQQPELALLENLDFTQLESNVKFTPDGWVFFDFSLQGNNPDKKQGVNFNYSHQENLFSLLESIRLVKSVENKIEQKITQGDKK